MNPMVIIQIILIVLPDRADGKSTKTCSDPSALNEAITALQRTIEKKERRDEREEGR